MGKGGFYEIPESRYPSRSKGTPTLTGFCVFEKILQSNTSSCSYLSDYHVLDQTNRDVLDVASSLLGRQQREAYKEVCDYNQRKEKRALSSQDTERVNCAKINDDNINSVQVIKNSQESIHHNRVQSANKICLVPVHARVGYEPTAKPKRNKCVKT